MFKRSGALSGTRRASKKPSPLPKRGTQKDLETSEKGSERAQGKKHQLRNSIDQEEDKEKGSENEISLENIVDAEASQHELVVEAEDDVSVDIDADDPVCNSNIDSGPEAVAGSVPEQCESTQESIASEEFEKLDTDVGQSALDREEDILETDQIDQKFNESKEDMELDFKKEVNVSNADELKKESNGATPLEDVKSVNDLLIDAEDCETFQDLSTKPDIVTERSANEPMTLEMKSSDMSGLVSGGVISLQYPEDDARSLGSVQLELDDAKAQEDQKVDKVSRTEHELEL